MDGAAVRAEGAGRGVGSEEGGRVVSAALAVGESGEGTAAADAVLTVSPDAAVK